MTTPGPSIDETDHDSLEFDLRCSLVDAARSPVFLGTFGHAMKEALLEVLAREAAPILLARTGGRYLPKRDDRERRNAQIVAMFDGKNRDEVMRHFKISRRVFYRVITEYRKRLRSHNGV